MFRYAAKASLFLVIVLLTNIVLFLWVSQYQTSYLASYYDKHRHLTETKSPKIVFVGGSGLAFAMDSQQIVDRLHEPVINMGLYAALGLPLMLQQVKGSIHAGDTVVISPEYELFAVDYDGPGLDQYLDVVPSDTQYEKGRILPVLWNGLTYPRAIPVITAKVHAWLQTPVEKADVNNDANLRGDFNIYGDYTRQLGQQPLSPDSLNTQTRTMIPAVRLDSMIAAMNAFDAYVRAQGAHTIYLFPPLMETQYLKNAEHIAQIEQRLRQNLTFPIIGSPQDYTYPAQYHFDTVYHLNKRGRELHTQQIVADLTRAIGTTVNISAEDANPITKLDPVPVRFYTHAPVLHTVGFGDIQVTNGTETLTVPSGGLQPWQTDADRSIASDTQERGGPRTIALNVRSSATDPWMSPVSLDLANSTALNVRLTTNTGDSGAMDEQVALVAEVRGPGGEIALFTSPPAQTQAGPQTVQFTALFSAGAGVRAGARVGCRAADRHAGRVGNWLANPALTSHHGHAGDD